MTSGGISQIGKGKCKIDIIKRTTRQKYLVTMVTIIIINYKFLNLTTPQAQILKNLFRVFRDVVPGTIVSRKKEASSEHLNEFNRYFKVFF